MLDILLDCRHDNPKISRSCVSLISAWLNATGSGGQAESIEAVRNKELLAMQWHASSDQGGPVRGEEAW